MTSLIGILISIAITSFLTYISAFPVTEKSRRKYIFLVFSVLNFVISLILVIAKDREEKAMSKQVTQWQKAQDGKISDMLHKEDLVQQSLSLMGMKAEFSSGKVKIINNNFYTNARRQNEFVQPSLRTNPKPNKMAAEIENDKQRSNDESKEVTVEQPTTSPNITESMSEESCLDKVSNYQYSQCCFDNRTGLNLVMVKYDGYWGTPVIDKQILVLAGTHTCSGKLFVDHIGRLTEREFRFYFTKEDGTPCKYQIPVTLKRCVETTLTLTKANLGL